MITFLFILYSSKPIDTTLSEYKTRCGTLKTESNYVEPQPFGNNLKKTNRLGGTDNVMREVNQIQDAKYTNSLRRDLLGVNANDVSGLRKRGTNTGSEDMSQAMKHHADLQEKIAEDMLALTRNLKEQTETANRIIKKDTDVRFRK